MNCIFQKMGDNFVCINCGYETPYKEYPGGIKRACKKPKSSFASKLKNGAIEIKKQAEAIIDNDVPADTNIVEDRLEICNNCEHFKKNMCLKCGCILSFKTRLKHSNCPIGKW